MQEHHATVSDIPVRWLEWGGDGAPIVFIHGIPTSPLLWRYVVRQLETTQSLAWEMVGYGASWDAGGDREISVRAQASYLRAWLDHLELDNVILVGHDLGGGVAQIAAVENSHRFAGMVLINSISYNSWPIQSVNAMRRIGGLLERTPPSLFRGVFSSFLRRGHDDQRIAADSINTHWRHYDHRHGPKAFRRQIDSLNTQDTMSVAARLRGLDLPAEIVWGEADRFQKASYAERLANDLRGGLDLIKGGKHFVPEDHPDRVAEAIRRLMKSA